jgi:hypothetical protein
MLALTDAALAPLCYLRHGPRPDRRRALELLAASPEGCIEALMLANGFPVEMLVELIRIGLASAQFTEYMLKCRPAQRMF